MEQLPETIGCPYCGNVNPFMQENCMKCGKPLGPIRAAMGVDQKPEESQDPKTEPKVPQVSKDPPKNIAPIPLLPEFKPVPENGTLGLFFGSRVVLIRGMGARREELAARFFKQLLDRNIEGVELFDGSISIRTDSGKEDRRDFYFIEKGLGSEAISTMAVRFSPSGSDLYIEWRNYAVPSTVPRKFDKFLGCVGVLFYGLGVLYWIYYVFAKIFSPNVRNTELEGFQLQDNQAFQLSVRAALEEAIDLAGISKSFIQNMSDEGNKDKRVI